MRDTNVSLEYLHFCLDAYIYILFLVYFLWPSWSKLSGKEGCVSRIPQGTQGVKAEHRAPLPHLTDSWEFIHDSFFSGLQFSACVGHIFIPEGFGAFFPLVL